MFALILLRCVGMLLLGVLLAFSFIGPLLAVVLLIVVAVSNNVAVRLLANVNRLGTKIYLVNLVIVFGLAGLWLSSIITWVLALSIFIPVEIGYWIISWTKPWE